jgi:hypothetical protein
MSQAEIQALPGSPRISDKWGGSDGLLDRIGVMNRIAASFGRMFALLSPVGYGQPVPAAACPPSTTLDELKKGLDEAVSGPGDKDRACLREIWQSNATAGPVPEKYLP